MTEYRTLVPLFDALVGERVIVRPYRLDDAEAVQAAIATSRDHLRPWLPFADAHQTVDETRDFITKSIAEWLLRENFHLTIRRKDDDMHLGGIGFHVRHWETRHFEIGYWLRPSEEGKGFVSEAVRLVTSFLFNQLAATRVMIRCDERNTRSAAVPQRLGFVHEGTFRESEPGPNETLRSMHYFALIRSDPRPWEAQT